MTELAKVFPLNETGATSEMYTVEFVESIPKPMPLIILPNIKMFIDGAVEMIIDPKTNRELETKIMGFQPYESVNGPESNELTAAAINATAIINSLSETVMAGHVSLKYNYAPDMTPASKPNDNLPSDPATMI